MEEEEKEEERKEMEEAEEKTNVEEGRGYRKRERWEEEINMHTSKDRRTRFASYSHLFLTCGNDT